MWGDGDAFGRRVLCSPRHGTPIQGTISTHQAHAGASPTWDGCWQSRRCPGGWRHLRPARPQLPPVQRPGNQMWAEAAIPKRSHLQSRAIFHVLRAILKQVCKTGILIDDILACVRACVHVRVCVHTCLGTFGGYCCYSILGDGRDGGGFLKDIQVLVQAHCVQRRRGAFRNWGRGVESPRGLPL